MNTGQPPSHAPLHLTHVNKNNTHTPLYTFNRKTSTLRRAMMNREYGQERPHTLQLAGGGEQAADEQRKPSAGAMRMFLSPVPEMRLMGAGLLKKPLDAPEAAQLDGYAKLMEASPEHMVEDLVRELIQVITCYPLPETVAPVASTASWFANILIHTTGVVRCAASKASPCSVTPRKVNTSHMHSHFSYPRLAHRHVRGRMHHK